MRTRRHVIAAVLAFAAGAAHAWSNHALGTWAALSTLPSVVNAPPVEVESLARFVAADPKALARVLADEEAWARANLPGYAPRPDTLALRAEPAATPEELARRFVGALRINPASRLALYLQLAPGVRTPEGRSTLPEEAVTTLRTTEASKLNTFVALREGEKVAVIDVVASASDEPDYGLDVGLWADNHTLQGQAYGFGKQPFGNPTLEFSSQAPLHMAFFHESAIVYRAAAFLKRTYPEARVHLYRTLAAHALATGHPYWGWRFAGWAMHYVQDLTQPYHARVLPGVGTARMLWVNTIDLVGVKSPKEHAITLVSNRHLALENFQRGWLRAAQQGRPEAANALQALRDTANDGAAAFDDTTLRSVVSEQASRAADTLDAALLQRLPAKYTSDPGYTFGVSETGLDLYAELGRSAPAERIALEAEIAPLMARFGTHTRSLVRSLVTP
jgi:hypothetical protein